ncbi:MAG: hypothetical protein R2712_00390, partial [Vicinamibacterales bacterium]
MMDETRVSAPFDVRRPTTGNVAAGIVFLLLSAVAFFLALSGVVELPRDMATFPLTPIGTLFGSILALMGVSALAQARGFRV